MIVLILTGGIGNQMFEYAAARALSLRNNTQLVINTRIGFERDRFYHRVYCLNVFNVSFIKKRLVSFDFPFGSILDRLSRRIGFHVLCPWYKYLYQERVSVSDLFEPLKHRNVILSGGWINQVYFQDYLSQIRQDFTLAVGPPSVVNDYIHSITTGETPVVAMGIRIYQEVQNERIREGHYFRTNSEFYNKAILYLKSRIGRFKLLVFTQAEEWARDNIDFTDVDFEFVKASTNDYDAINDMMIMSHCHHYIISNSTFYFWGCWLNPSLDKIVIVPKSWEKVPLEEWIKL